MAPSTIWVARRWIPIFVEMTVWLALRVLR